MRDHDDRAAVFLIDRFDQLEDLLGGDVIKCAGRFVAEQDVGVLDDCSADRGALLLSAGKLIREFVAVFVETERFEDIVHIQRIVTQIGAYFDILLDVEIWDEVIHLENVAEVLAAVAREGFLVHVGCFLAADGDEAGVCTVDAADDVEQSGFAGAGRPEQDTEFAFFEGEGDAFQYVDTAFALTEMLFDVADLNKHSKRPFCGYLSAVSLC